MTDAWIPRIGDKVEVLRADGEGLEQEGEVYKVIDVKTGPIGTHVEIFISENALFRHTEWCLKENLKPVKSKTLKWRFWDFFRILMYCACCRDNAEIADVTRIALHHVVGVIERTKSQEKINWSKEGF